MKHIAQISILVFFYLFIFQGTAYATSPTVKVGVLQQNAWCNATGRYESFVVTAVSKPVDIDTFTRDSLPQELTPSAPVEALKANAVLIRSIAYHYHYNPQSNWFCDNTGQGYHLTTATMNGWRNGRGATEGNLTVGSAKKTNDLVTDTMGQILVQNGRTFETRFCDTSQEKYLVEKAKEGHNYNTLLTNRIYNQATCSDIPRYTGLSIRHNSYIYRPSMTNGTSPATVNGGWHTYNVTPVNHARQAEHYWGHSHIDATYHYPFGQYGLYMAGWHGGDKVEYLMNFGGAYENLHLIGIADISGPVDLNIYIDGKYQRQIRWTQADNKRHLRVDKITGMTYGTHAIAIEFANDYAYCPYGYHNNCDRNFYLDVLGVNDGDIGRSGVRNMFLRHDIFLPLMHRD